MNYYDEDDDIVLKEHCCLDGYQVLYSQDTIEEIGILQAESEMSLEIKDARRRRRMHRHLERMKSRMER